MNPGTAASTPRKPRAIGPRSLRVRLTVWVVLVNSVILWAAIAIFWLYQRSSSDQIHNLRRLSHATRLATDMELLLPGATSADVDAATERLMGAYFYERAVVEVFDHAARPLFTDRPARVDPVTAGVAEELLTGLPHFNRLRMILSDHPNAAPEVVRLVSVGFVGTDGQRYVVTLLTSDLLFIHQQAVVRGALLLCGIVGPIGSTVGAWYIAGIAVTPFERLRRLASSLVPGARQVPAAELTRGAPAEAERLAEELEDARRRVAERFAAQNRFISNVAHELRTPISVLLTEAQTIKRGALNPEGLDFVDSVVDEMTKLGRLIESFLTLTQIQDTKGHARLQHYAVNDLLMDSLENCRKMAEQHHVRLEPTLLAQDENLDAAITGERELLRNMLDNLLRNAIRFSPADAVVRVIADTPGRVATITVRDEGPGIPADRIDTIFNRFATAPNQPPDARGHGLGLAIALGIAELHAGTIAASNLPHRGCEFVITLPLRTPDPMHDQTQDDTDSGDTPPRSSA